jgi:hypothetical protein
MKKMILTGVILTAGIAFFSACADSSAKKNNIIPVMDSTALVARGEYLVNAIGCDDCHSPKKMGPNGPEIITELRLSGFPHDGKLPSVNKAEIKKGFSLFAPDLTAAVGPWGASFAANITSDETGIGNWTEANFIRAIRHGKLKGLENSRPLLPPMPWVTYKNFNDTDLRSIFAYLKTVKPVDNLVPAPIPLDQVK